MKELLIKKLSLFEETTYTSEFSIDDSSDNDDPDEDIFDKRRRGKKHVDHDRRKAPDA